METVNSEQLLKIKNDAYRATYKGGGVKVITDEREFESLIDLALRLRGFMDDVLQGGFVGGLTDVQLVSMAMEWGFHLPE